MSDTDRIIHESPWREWLIDRLDRLASELECTCMAKGGDPVRCHRHIVTDAWHEIRALRAAVGAKMDVPSTPIPLPPRSTDPQLGRRTWKEDE